MARLVLICTDRVSARRIGFAMKYWNWARQLVPRHEVTLAYFQGEQYALGAQPFRTELITAPEQLQQLVASADHVLFYEPSLLREYSFLRRNERSFQAIVDLTNPIIWERLECHTASKCVTATDNFRYYLEELKLLIAHGDQFICAHRHQSLLYYPFIAELRPALLAERCILELPFGVAAAPKAANAGEYHLRQLFPAAADCQLLLLWGGGVWDWFDPLVVMQACLNLVGRLDVHLVFPFLDCGGAKGLCARQVSLLAAQSSIFHIGDSPIPQAHLQAAFASADVGVSAHRETVEMRYAIRTRVWSYIEALLPVVATSGDYSAELLEGSGGGLTCPPGAVAAWEEALLKMADLKLRSRAKAGLQSLQERFAWPLVLAPLAVCLGGGGGMISPAEVVAEPLSREPGAAELSVPDFFGKDSRQCRELLAAASSITVAGPWQWDLVWGYLALYWPQLAEQYQHGRRMILADSKQFSLAATPMAGPQPSLVGRSLLVFGAGRAGRHAWDILTRAGLSVAGFIDNRPTTQCCQLPVWGPPQIARLPQPFIFIASMHEAEISAQLSELGYSQGADYASYKSIYHYIL